MTEDRVRRSELRDNLCDQLGSTVTEMLLDYMPSADWTDNIDRQFVHVERRFLEIDRRFELIDQRFDEINRRFELIDQRFEQIDQRLDRLEARVGRLETAMEKLIESQRTWIRWMISATVASALAAVGAIVSLAVSAM